jgi:hypothetical protein
MVEEDLLALGKLAICFGPCVVHRWTFFPAGLVDPSHAGAVGTTWARIDIVRSPQKAKRNAGRPARAALGASSGVGYRLRQAVDPDDARHQLVINL